jgi:polyisoprenoid-binding protein YceI
MRNHASITPAERLAGVRPLAEGTWSIDRAHTSVAFIGRQFGLVKVRGRFAGVRGTVEVAGDPTQSRVDVTIDMGSVDSGSRRRDDHLRSAAFIDVDTHPTARFRSTSVTGDRTRGTMTGDLTLKGVTLPVVLDVEYLANARDAAGDTDRASFRATATVDRHGWGVTWNLLDRAGLMISNSVKLVIDVELVRS